jgi:hypothetical protein
MRTVATLAAILVLPCGLIADDAQTTKLNIAIAAPAKEQCECPAVMLTGTPTSSKYDTSVYQLKHVHARQIIPVVQRAICKHAAESVGEHAAQTVVSVAFMPTTSDDALIAVCRREHAALVKQAIEECDVARQYAVKVQLFEVTAGGETVPVGAPSVIVGREGSVECKSESHGPITVSLQVSDSVSETTDAIAKAPASTDLPEEANCSGPDCGQPAVSCPVTKGACPVSCSGQADETCVCPACKEAASVSGQCGTCSGTCEVTATAVSDCKCGASCKCGSKDEVAEASGESPASLCEKCAEASAHSAEFTTDEYRTLVRILLTHWLEEHRERTDGVARDDASSDPSGECCFNTLTCPSAQSGCVANSGRPHRHLELEVDLGSPAPVSSNCATPGCAERDLTISNQCLGPVVLGTPAEEGLFVRRMRICTDGCVNETDDVAVAHVTDCDRSECPCNGSCHSCDGPAAEPPALLTLSPLKDGAPIGILISPEWQAELSRKYQGRRLSEIFELHNGQDPGAAALHGLFAVIANPEGESANSGVHHHNVIVLDLPEHIRMFDGKCDANAAACGSASCHDSLRALLEDVLQSPILQSVNQTGHAEYDESVAKSPRQLPSVSHSQIDTTVCTYSLKDLILLDDKERPVFDTCTIIEHLQAAVAPESWAHPSVSIQFDQQTTSLVIRQTPDVHKKIEAHLHELRRLQVKRLCKMIERLSTESESSDD